MLCKLCGFPIPDDLDIDNRERIALWEIYDQTLKRVKLYGKYAIEYENEFKGLRHAYSHNMRVLLLELFEGKESEPEAADIVGIMKPSTRRPNHLTLLCKTQRRAMSELAIRLCQIEQILYQNLQFYVLNGCNPVPPVAAIHIPTRFQGILVEIKKKLELVWDLPAFRVEIRDSVIGERQYSLHKEFLRKLDKLNSRR